MPVPKGVRIGGRQKGTPNKVTNDLKALAQVYTAEAVKTLAEHMRGENPKASVAAARELLDRGHGKAGQPITGADGGPLVVQILKIA